MRRIEIRVISSSERGGIDTHPAHRVHAVLAAERRPRSAPDGGPPALRCRRCDVQGGRRELECVEGTGVSRCGLRCVVNEGGEHEAMRAVAEELLGGGPTPRAGRRAPSVGAGRHLHWVLVGENATEAIVSTRL